MQQDLATYDLSPQEFRSFGYCLIEQLSAYYAGIPTAAVVAQRLLGALCNAPAEILPERCRSFGDILMEMQQTILPAVLENPAGNRASLPLVGLLGEMTAAQRTQTRYFWRMKSSATELEQVVVDWLRQWLSLPAPFIGLIHHHWAMLQALSAAREALPLARRRQGMSRRVPRLLRLYCSEETHVSVDKAAMVLFIGQQGVRKISTDHAFRMDVAKLEDTIREDQKAGWYPFAVVATIGTTETGSIDPIPQIAALCERYHLWLHVDGAFGAAAALVPHMRWALAGWERADSLTIHPHHWLFTPLGCGILYTRRPETFKAISPLTPEYLWVADQTTNLSMYGDYLPHGFPALKLWVTMRYFGQERLAAIIRYHCSLAQLFSGWIDASPDFERLAPVFLPMVCFRAHPRGMDDEPQVNYPRTEFGSFGVVTHAGSSQANQFDAYRQASCRSKKLALRMARRDKAVTFLPTTLRRGTHQSAIRLQTCKRTDKSIEYLFCFVKCKEGLPDLQMNQEECGSPFLNALNERLFKRINEMGACLLSCARLHGVSSIRVAFGNLQASFSTVSTLWELVQATLAFEQEAACCEEALSSLTRPEEVAPW